MLLMLVLFTLAMEVMEDRLEGLFGLFMEVVEVMEDRRHGFRIGT